MFRKVDLQIRKVHNMKYSDLYCYTSKGNYLNSLLYFVQGYRHSGYQAGRTGPQPVSTAVLRSQRLQRHSKMPL